MTVVYHETLPDSYLLILAPGREGRPENGLAYWLGCAQQSGKPAVWVDCGMLKSLSSEAIQLLWHTHYQLQEKHVQLVLVHLSEHIHKEFLEQDLGPAPSIVPTLLDAARQTGWHEVV